MQIDGEEVRIGLEVCEDLWINDYRIKNGPVNPTQYYLEKNSNLIINISCSPWTYQKNEARDRRVKEIYNYSLSNNSATFVPFLYVNNVGSQNNGKNIITFDGGSTVYNAQGEPILFDTPFKEDLIIIDDAIFKEKGQKRPEYSKMAQKNKAIITGLQCFKEILGWQNDPKFIIGMSGGVDSSLVTALIVQALGKDHVMGVNLPTKYNTEKTKSAAKFVADALDIPYLVVPIEDITQKITETIENANFPGMEKSLSSLNKENIQAKIRGTSILSNLAAKYGGFFTNNGNKLEIALGYATLYGDVGGAIAPIGDLTKVETYQMVVYLNEEIFKKKVIPDSLIPDELYQFNEGQIPPSAELKEDQFDPMKFGYHDAVLDAFTHFRKKGPQILAEWFLDGSLAENLGISEKIIQRWGIDDPKVFIEDLEWFTRLFYQSIFKRVQAPPIIITSRSAFGYDIRESQIPWVPSQAYLRLKDQILKK